MQDYIDFLTRHRFNAVRLPLNSVLVNDNSQVGTQCGEYNGWATLDVLDDVLSRLRAAGLFVLLDMHTSVYPEGNTRLWCGGASDSCSAEDEAPVKAAWETLAGRYCSSHPNIIGADLYNEPHGATWGHGEEGVRWDLAAERLGAAVQRVCTRWLIVVEGANGDASSSCAPNGCWWGEVC